MYDRNSSNLCIEKLDTEAAVLTEIARCPQRSLTAACAPYSHCHLFGQSVNQSLPLPTPPPPFAIAHTTLPASLPPCISPCLRVFCVLFIFLILMGINVCGSRCQMP